MNFLIQSMKFNKIILHMYVYTLIQGSDFFCFFFFAETIIFRLATLGNDNFKWHLPSPCIYASSNFIIIMYSASISKCLILSQNDTIKFEKEKKNEKNNFPNPILWRAFDWIYLCVGTEMEKESNVDSAQQIVLYKYVPMCNIFGI